MMSGFSAQTYMISNPYNDMPKTPTAEEIIKAGFRDTYVVMKTKKRSKSKERMKKQSRRSNRR